MSSATSCRLFQRSNVFKVQSQAGRSGIFWEKESIPKNDKKFGYKKRTQRFPIRRHVDDTHYVDTGLETLTPDEPQPPKPPAKNFIKRNRDRLASKKGPDTKGTVTLTQEQLNAILKSVGNVAGGKDNALKISIDGTGEKNQITIESPRRDDDGHDHRGRKEKQRSKSKRHDDNKEEESTIFSLLQGVSDDKPSRNKADSGLESQGSDGDDDGSYIERKAAPRRRKGRDEYSDNRRRTRSKKRPDSVEDYEDNYRDSRNKHKKNVSNNRTDEYEEDNERQKKYHSKRTEDYDDDVSDNDKDYHRRSRKNVSNKRTDDYDEDNERRRRHHKRNDDYDDDSDNDRDYHRRTRDKRNESDSRERQADRFVKESDLRKRSPERDERRNKLAHNTSLDEGSGQETGTPREAVGLPMDLSWRHMTKAERRRLMMARQKLTDEEEKREEERIRNMITRLERDVPTKAEKKRAVQSDPVSREDQRDNRRVGTEDSRYTEDYRRGRRERSPSEKRNRTPERSRSPESYQHNIGSSPKEEIVPLPKQHLTLAEKKRIEWERERVESSQLQRVGEYDPWGKPGAGAPLRTKSGHLVADYKYRQENMHGENRIPEESETKEERGREEVSHPPPSHPPPPPSQGVPTHRQGAQEQSDLPHAMRSSFVIGLAAPDAGRFESRKEEERKQWLADLEKQIEEKRMKEMKNSDLKEENTWAEKLGQSHRPIPFPEQPQTTVSGLGDPFGQDPTDRTKSLPEVLEDDKENTFIRGQNVPIDAATKKEMEDKRRRHLEHQAAIMAQVEEKQREKQAERQKKMQEDMEEEQKLQTEREKLQKQFDMEQQKSRQKEQQRQAQVNMLKAAMDDAQAKAMQDKYQRKMQHLEKGGHDTTKLRENLEDQMTSRIEELHTKRQRDLLRYRQLQSEYPNTPITEAFRPKRQPVPRPAPKQPAKITPREGQSERGGPGPGPIHVEPSFVPGLDLGTSRTNQAGMYVQDSRRDLPHEPYTEDRVLTPSRFRAPSKPWSDPGSPRREFGTQTGNQIVKDHPDHPDHHSEFDADDVALALLNRSYDREMSEVNIEYRMERGRRVRVVSAPREALERRTQRQPHPPAHPSPHHFHHEHMKEKEKEEERKKRQLEKQLRRGPVRPGARPKWNYRNVQLKKAAKQSERDPFYEQKKRDSDFRRMKRERKLMAMVEANKSVIPDHYTASARSRDLSPVSEYGGGTPREVSVSRRSKSHSPSRLQSGTDYLAVHQEDSVFPYQKPKISSRPRSRSPPTVRPAQAKGGRASRVRSPPIPALKHRAAPHRDRSHRDNLEEDLEKNDISRRRGKTNYGDIDPVTGPLQNNDFVPFTRTIDVLDPIQADDPLPLSREGTRIANARKAYHESLNPERFGNPVDVYEDKQRAPAMGPHTKKNPLLNPGMVTDHPTARQDQILMQLSSLKQTLMQRQRELETFSPTDLE